MIVKVHNGGKSFKGLSTYLTHDPKAQTAERVQWTHTLNVANDHVPSAIDEMLWTARNAELLKQEAGVRAGGRKLERPVKHVSLNWAPDENPTREHMIEASESYLRHMKWEDHQALLVAHTDKHPHVHILLNVVHPETGMSLDDNFDWRRSQKWAKEYEREHGIHCQNRERPEEEREEAPTRPMWTAFKGAQRKYEENENQLATQAANSNFEPKIPKNKRAAEWAELKKIQREERDKFFAEGKLAFSELRTTVYHEIREDFRERWSDYFTLVKEGYDAEALKEMKDRLVAEQKTALEERRDAVCGPLLEQRKETYRELLDGQSEIRRGLIARQYAGLDTGDLIRVMQARTEEAGPVAVPGAERPMVIPDTDRPFGFEPPREEVNVRSDAAAGMKSGSSMVGGIAGGLGNILVSFLTAGTGSEATRGQGVPPKSTVDPNDLFRRSADDARRFYQREAEIEEERRRTERDSARQ